MLVSIIMPNYNGDQYISYAIESVLAQTYKNFELIVVDDHSTDESIDIIKQYCLSDQRVILLTNTYPKQVNGPTAARNTAIAKATGELIAFLDSDDIWYPHKLQSQINFMRHNNASFVYCWYDIMLADGKIIAQNCPNTTQKNYHSLLKNCEIGCLTVIYNQIKLGKQYINNLDPLGDFSLWLQILKITPATCQHEKLAAYRLTHSSISANKLKTARHFWYVLVYIEKLSVPKAIYYFSCYIIISLTTKLKPLLYRWLNS